MTFMCSSFFFPLMKKEAKKSSLHRFSLLKTHPRNEMKRTHTSAGRVQTAFHFFRSLRWILRFNPCRTVYTAIRHCECSEAISPFKSKRLLRPFIKLNLAQVS